jgi:hypothetical protein
MYFEIVGPITDHGDYRGGEVDSPALTAAQIARSGSLA